MNFQDENIILSELSFIKKRKKKKAYPPFYETKLREMDRK